MIEPQIPDVLSTLRNPGTTIALEGTLGPPDFVVATGTRRHRSGSVWCVTMEHGAEDPFGDAGPRDYPVFHYDELILDADGRELVGNFDCFPDF